MRPTETSTDASRVVTPTVVLPASAGPVAGTAEALSPDVLAKLQELEERSAAPRTRRAWGRTPPATPTPPAGGSGSDSVPCSNPRHRHHARITDRDRRVVVVAARLEEGHLHRAVDHRPPPVRRGRHRPHRPLPGPRQDRGRPRPPGAQGQGEGAGEDQGDPGDRRPPCSPSTCAPPSSPRRTTGWASATAPSGSPRSPSPGASTRSPSGECAPSSSPSTAWRSTCGCRRSSRGR